MIVIKSIPLNIAEASTTCTEFDNEVNGAILKERVSELLGGLPLTSFSLYRSKNKINEDDPIRNGDIVHLHLSLKGGKGGFGSMLRAIGAQIEKTTNKEACRDLSGRRLRDINEEQRLKKWIAKQAERERERAERKQQRLQRLQAKPRNDFHDPEYDKVYSNLSANIDSALSQGLKSAQQESTTSKRKLVDKPPSTSKKLKGWMDTFEDLASGSSSDESESNSSTNVSVPAASESSENSKDGETSEREAITNDGDDNTSTSDGQSSSCSTDRKQTLPESVSPCAFDSTECNEVDLELVSSVEELETFGLQRLKQALVQRGMKCGGTLRQRAERLFAVKGKTSIDSNLLAKVQKTESL